MTLTNIQKYRNKIILKFDNYETLKIYYDVFLNFSLFKGNQLTLKEIDEIKLRNSEFEVKNSAFRYLSNRSHSAFELKTKLKKKGFDIEIIQRVILDLEDEKYLNDFTFAKNFVRNRVERKKVGVVKISSELYKKGISKEIIAEVTESINTHPMNFKNALELGKNKYESIIKRGETDNNKVRAKLFNYIKGRGFTNDVVFEVINKILTLSR